MAPLSSSLRSWRQVTMAFALYVTPALTDRNPHIKRHDEVSPKASTLEKTSNISGPEETFKMDREVAKAARDVLQRKDKYEQGTEICGDPQIKVLIAGKKAKSRGEQANQIAGIDWKDVTKRTTEALRAKGLKINKTWDRLTELERQIAAAPELIDKANLTRLVDEAIASGFSTEFIPAHEKIQETPLDIAKDTDCGEELLMWYKEKTGSTQGLEAILKYVQDLGKQQHAAGSQKFEELVDEYLTKYDVCIEEGDIIDYINDQYMQEDAEDESWCDDIGRVYAEKATDKMKEKGRMSYAKILSLQDEQMKNKKLVEKYELDRDECEQDKDILDKFHEELQKLIDQEKEQRLQVNKYKVEISSVKGKLFFLQEEATEREIEFIDALEILTKAQALTNTTKKKLEEAIMAERRINQTIAETEEKLAALLQKIDVATAAKKTADSLKIDVTKAMVQVVVMYEEVVVNPLEEMGLSALKDQDLFDEYWVADSGVEKVQEAVNKLDAFCAADGEGGKAFKLVPKSVTPKPDVLCQFGDASQRVAEVNETVQRMVAEAKSDLMGLKEYLELAGNKEEEQEGGEPQGLAAIIGNTRFYNTYLRHWYRKDKENFQDLIENLGMHIEELKKNEEELNLLMGTLVLEQKDTMNKTQAVVEALRQVLEDEKVATSNKVEAERLFHQAQEDVLKAEQELKDLEASKKQASNTLTKITKELVNTHGEAVSFLQRVDKLHETGALYARDDRIFRQVEGSPALDAPRNRK